MFTNLRGWWTAFRKASRHKGRHWSGKVERVSAHYSPLTASLRAYIREAVLDQPFRPLGPANSARALRIAPYVL
jgi:hypothetical protein